MVVPYAHNWEYLTAELNLLDLLIRREVQKCRLTFAQDQQTIFKGVFISEEEIEQLLSTAPEEQSLNDAAPPDALLSATESLRAKIAQRKRASLERGVSLMLPRLAQLFSLTDLEERIVLVCLAQELDLKYERLFAYLQDDMTRKRPSVELIRRLLCRTSGEKLHARTFFSSQATLFRFRILRFLDSRDTPQLARLLKVEDRIVNFLLELDEIDEELAESTSMMSSSEELGSLCWADEFKNQLLHVVKTHRRNRSRPRRKLIYHLHGPTGNGKKSLAAGLCGELGLSLMIVDVRQALRRTQDFAQTVRAILREAILQHAAIYLEHFDQLSENAEPAFSHQRSIARAIEDFPSLVFLSTEKAWEPAGLFAPHLFFSVELPMPDLSARVELWKALTAADERIAPEMNWGELAAKYHLTPGQMKHALITARHHAHLRGGEHAAVVMDDLYQGCRSQSNQKLAALAQKLPLHYSWPDITLPRDSMAQLREVCAQMKHRQTVFDTWGFERKLSLGKGLCVLFYGPSGTGKTMAVEIIARELHLDAFKIDLSTVVSKYIGETEKNLGKIFREAETSNAILFFDEADALFGKRSEIKDAHDRYANIEINYLLQRIEEFDGIVILATNLRKNIDEAFFRRMNFAIEFPFPKESDRYRIWKQHFPETAPLAGDIDFDFLANRLSITGGNIKNIVINAAFLAAENSGIIHMKHLIRASKREYEKIGRLCTETEFAPYHALLREEE